MIFSTSYRRASYFYSNWHIIVAHADYSPFIYTDIGVYFHLRPSTKDVAPLKTEVRTKGKLKLRDTKKKKKMEWVFRLCYFFSFLVEYKHKAAALRWRLPFN